MAEKTNNLLVNFREPFRGLFLILLPIVIYVYATPRSYPMLYPIGSALIMFMMSYGTQGELIEAKLKGEKRYRQRWIAPIFLGTVVMIVVIVVTSIVKQFM